MLVPLGWAQRRLAVSLHAPELARIRDAYLRVFSDLAPHAELVATLGLACRVGKVARALTWTRAVAQSDPGQLDEHYANGRSPACDHCSTTPTSAAPDHS